MWEGSPVSGSGFAFDAEQLREAGGGLGLAAAGVESLGSGVQGFLGPWIVKGVAKEDLALILDFGGDDSLALDKAEAGVGFLLELGQPEGSIAGKRRNEFAAQVAVGRDKGKRCARLQDCRESLGGHLNGFEQDDSGEAGKPNVSQQGVGPGPDDFLTAPGYGGAAFDSVKTGPRVLDCYYVKCWRRCSRHHWRWPGVLHVVTSLISSPLLPSE